VLPDYTNWQIVDSDTGYVPANTTDYATQRTVKEAAAWINAQDSATPWFATIAFHSPHAPFHVPPGGYDRATAGNQASNAYKFNIMAQNMDANIGRLLGTSGVVGGALFFDPIPQDQLSNTIMIFLGDNGSPEEIALEEAKTEIYEGSVRAPLCITDGQAVMNEINAAVIAPRFLHASRLNTTSRQMVHVVDLYMTIVRLVDPAANAFPSDTDSTDLSDVLKTAPIRLFNFSQWYASDGIRATIRNGAYKLNYTDNPLLPEYTLYQYTGGEIPNREDDGTALDLFTDALTEVNADAARNLNLLLDELLANYQRDATTAFPDPR
jgi:arylsulfatase A-like enzyme